jgi:hypothetical protein
VRRLALIVLLALAACQDRTHIDTLAAPVAASPELLTALERAQNFHHRADVLLRDGKPDAAIAEIAHVLEVHFPAGAPEADDVRLDARARLGTLYLGAGRLDDAERVVQEGLVSGARDSFFLANLYNVRGQLHEARAASLENGDAAAAKAELRRAIAAYARGQDINVRVQARVYQEAMP